ncbi:MAG TPA: T9SS type A sorting domain-containing protein [Chitinophagales bacterium]|nr:T9SS type A sorting domain-containing protein [Chitinophagales bacterium]
MKPTILSAILWLGIMGTSFGQSFHFLENIDNGMPTNTVNIATDPTGNTYMTGTFFYELTIQDITLTSDEYMTCFLAKYDKNGILKWLKPIPASGANFPTGIVFNKVTKGVTLCGGFNDTMNINGVTHISNGNIDAFWMSLDANGNILNGATAGGDSSDIFYDVEIDKGGNVYVLGNSDSQEMQFNGVNQFMDATENTGLMAKFTADGSPVWMRTMTGDANFLAYEMAVGNNGTAYLGFKSTGSYFIHNGPDELYGLIKDISETNIILFSFTKNGDVFQSTEFETSSIYSSVSDVIFDGSATIAINFVDSIQVFGEYYYAEDGTGSIIARINFNTLEPEWAKFIFSPYGTGIMSLKNNGNTILCGGDFIYYAECDGLTVENPFADPDALLVTLNRNTGLVLGFADFDNVESYDYIVDVDVDKNKNIYLAGMFNGLIYFDAMSATSNDFYYNIFLTRLNATIFKEEAISDQSAITLYPNPAVEYITINGEIQHWEIINMEGQIILSGIGSTSSTTINLQSIPSGFYLLSTTNTNNEIITQEFVKQ